MITIYRVEHKKNGRGPYRNPLLKEEAKKLSSVHLSDRHPSPPILWRERASRDWITYSDFLFGFDSMEKLIFWFLDDFEYLKGLGYHIAVYEMKDSVIKTESKSYDADKNRHILREDAVKVFFSNESQAMFHEEYARKVKTIPL